jgi:opacity protein-like surface antigen
MKKNLYIFSMNAIALMTAASASAATFYPHGIYLGGGASYSWVNSTLISDDGHVTKPSSNSPGAYVDLGYAMVTLPIQLDLSYGTSLLSSDDTKITGNRSLQALFANVTLDGNFGWKFIPFVTSGFGVSNAGSHVDKTGSAWQVGAGTHYRLDDNLMIDASLNYQSLFNDTGNHQSSEKDKASQFKLGFTYVFGDQHIPPALIDD